jgi:membrane-associated phospholipid phosphatase
MLLLPYVPLGLAIFIAGTRYFDFRNHGFDVLAGAVVGSVTAYFGFRVYYPLLDGAERARGQ